MNEKRCPKCKVVKLLSEFYRLKSGKPTSWCKVCQNQRFREWKLKNKEHRRQYEYDYHRQPINQARRSVNRKKRVAASPRGVMAITLAHGLRRKYTENPATVDDLMEKWRGQRGFCALSGIRMTWALGKVTATSISLDRIDHSKGYSSDNLRLVCHAINTFRGLMSDDEMISMARALITKNTGPSWKSFLIHSEAA